jgi:hexosaminidase
MRITLLAIICVLTVSCTNKYKNVVNTEQEYQIIPKPAFSETANGQFLVDSNTKVVGAAVLENEGSYLVDLIGNSTLINVLFEEGTNGDGNILLKIDTSIEGEEAYIVSVAYDQITISGKTATGVFYGIQTLRQLMPAEIESSENKLGSFTIPAVTIKDSPRFEYRGMHLDVARHFYPVDFVKKYIDLIALHKMNTLHWHLTEDQGWRIEIKKYPKLTEIGSKRYGTIIGHHPGTGNDEKEYGGFYTQEEVKDIVKYATERHVTVIPEIELPGHSLAAIASYPSLSCFPEEPTKIFGDQGSKKGKEMQANGTPKLVYESWGVVDDVYCAGKEETFKFLEDVLAEVIPLFPGKYVHIGGDECPKGNWKRCPNCQARMEAEGLHDAHELQSYFIQRMEKYINSKGKSIIGWDEILEGGLAPNATVMSWQGTEGGITAAKQRHDVIMTPGHSVYFDHYQTEDNENEPLAIGGKTTVQDVYAFNPMPAELTAEEGKHVLGAQANVWSEYIPTTEYVEYMILPRMSALSEVVWSSHESKDWDDFRGRLNNLVVRFDVLGLNYAKHSLTEEK